jgi:hypothetical protein
MMKSIFERPGSIITLAFPGCFSEPDYEPKSHREGTHNRHRQELKYEIPKPCLRFSNIGNAADRSTKSASSLYKCTLGKLNQRTMTANGPYASASLW